MSVGASELVKRVELGRLGKEEESKMMVTESDVELVVEVEVVVGPGPGRH